MTGWTWVVKARAMNCHYQVNYDDKREEQRKQRL